MNDKPKAHIGRIDNNPRWQFYLQQTLAPNVQAYPPLKVVDEDYHQIGTLIGLKYADPRIELRMFSGDKSGRVFIERDEMIEQVAKIAAGNPQSYEPIQDLIWSRLLGLFESFGLEFTNERPTMVFPE